MNQYFIHRLRLLLKAFSIIADAIERERPIQPDELKALRQHIAKVEQDLAYLQQEEEE